MDVLINQPVGLGDIIWIQPIVDTYISRGYRVWYPVKDIYLDQVRAFMPKTGLYWVSDHEDFPMKSLYMQDEINIQERDEFLYMPITYADRHYPHSSIMMSKYYFAKHPLVNWHTHFCVQRDYGREEALMRQYNLFEHDYILVNQNFGTYPDYKSRLINFDSQGRKLHYLNIEEDMQNGFHIFDWIGAIEKAAAIHSVETSLCYFIDKYAKSVNINMYEKRREHDSPNYYRNVSLVYRNPNWSYHV